MEKYLLLVLIWTTQALLNYTYYFPFDPNQDPLAGKFNGYYSPSYFLGNLTTGRSLSIKVSLSNKKTQDLSNLQIQLYQQSSSASTFTQITMTTVSSTATYLQYKYDITFAGGSTTAAPFQIRAISSSFTDFNYFYLQVIYYITGQSSTAITAKTILKVAQTQRNIIYKYIYVASPTLLAFRLFPTDSINDNFGFTLYSINPSDWSRSNGYATNGQVATQSTFDDIMKIEKIISIQNVNPGYYLLAISYNPSPAQIAQAIKFNVFITFQTDIYKCPYNTSYADQYLNFQGCVKNITTPIIPQGGLPCLNFNPLTLRCLQCIDGYILLQYSCIKNTSCPDRQYFHFGTCLQVSDSCGSFDIFTGSCLNCSDSSYILMNGSCIPKNISCGSREYIKNNTCLNVSASCDQFNNNTGICLSCISNNVLNSDGTCTPAVVPLCSDGYYLLGSTCVPISDKCILFNYTISLCIKCASKYELRQGVCFLINCPPRMYPSKSGVCIKVQKSCQNFNPETGSCFNCIEGYSIRGGACLRIYSALAGCKEREQLGFGKCIEPKHHCRIYDQTSGDCIKCEDNYYLDYTGHCMERSICNFDQSSIDGRCVKIPIHCKSIDQSGLCIQCESKGFTLTEGICVSIITCGPHQYLNKYQVCVAVDPACATWNPSNGKCITCSNQTYSPSYGTCCPNGQFYRKQEKKCVSIDSNPCVIHHHTLDICLKCADGYTLDPSSLEGCFKL